MTGHFSRQFSRADLPDLLKLVTNNAISRLPHVTYLLNSDVAWRLPGSAPKDNIRLWFDDEGLAAFVWFEPNSPIAFDLRTDLEFDHPLCQEIIDWCTERRLLIPGMQPWLLDLRSMDDWVQALEEDRPAQASSKRYLQLIALDTDVDRIRFLERNGFKASAHFAYSLTRSLSLSIPGVDLPDGMRLRHVLAEDFPERVAVHRDSWFMSTFTMNNYLRIRAIAEYEPELDIVVEDSDGTFGSYCIGWVDRSLGVGSFEPVGTRPAYRRRNLGQQVNYEGLRRMKAFGMSSAKIGTAGFNDSAFGLYTSCGFSLIDKERTYVKRLG